MPTRLHRIDTMNMMIMILNTLMFLRSPKNTAATAAALSRLGTMEFSRS